MPQSLVPAAVAAAEVEAGAAVEGEEALRTPGEERQTSRRPSPSQTYASREGDARLRSKVSLILTYFNNFFFLFLFLFL
jgi:hypothetical protein